MDFITEELLVKLIITVVSAVLALGTGMIASLLVDDEEWKQYSARQKLGHRLVGLGISIVVSSSYFAIYPEFTEQRMWALFGTVSVLSFAGVEGRKYLLRVRLKNDD